MGNLFKFLLALTMLLTGTMHKGLAISEHKSIASVSLLAFAKQTTPDYHFFGKAAPVLKRGRFNSESVFHEDQGVLDEDKGNAYSKLLAQLPEALAPHPFTDLHLAPGFFHKPRKLLSLRLNSIRAYAGNPLCVLFGVFLI